MYRYRLVDVESGADLGPFVSLRMTFAAGEKLGRTPGERFTVVNVTDAEERDNVYAYLVVRRR